MAKKKKNSKINIVIIIFLIVFNSILFFIWKTNSPLPAQSAPLSTANYPEINDLANKNLSFTQLSTYFKSLSQRKSAEYAFTILKYAQLPPNTDLHLLGHVVGDILYKQEGVNGIRTCTQDFRNACSHAIVVNLFYDKGSSALSQIATACREAPGGKGAYTMCFHGLGHGVLAYNGYNLPKTIDDCKKTGTQEYGYQEYPQCVGGAVMEIISGGGHDHEIWAKQRPLYLHSNDPLYMCRKVVPTEAKTMCYIYITPYLFEAAGADMGHPLPKDFAKAFAFCDLMPSEDANRNTCFGGFGKEFVVLAKDRDIRNIDSMTTAELTRVIQWCSLTDDINGEKACLESSMQSLYWGGENKPDTTISFCNLIPDKQLQGYCFSQFLSAVSYYKPDKKDRLSVCNKLPTEDKSTCASKLL